MSIAPAVKPSVAAAARHWFARLQLNFARRGTRTALAGVSHRGPLRVQRPFYPEGPACCHVYLLHPPGGLVVGDELHVNLDIGEHCHTLVTTPSAGKLYAVPGGGARQTQDITIAAGEGGRIEWLPQETLVFDGADGRLNTRIDLAATADLFAWDIVCLGRPASNLPFVSGRAVQRIEVHRAGRLQFFEKNDFIAGHAAMAAPWGLAGCHTSGTLLATVSPDRTEVDRLVEELSALDDARHWGLTQKQDLFIARYRGNSALACRKGFTLLWQNLRPLWCNKPAAVPRIWAT